MRRTLLILSFLFLAFGRASSGDFPLNEWKQDTRAVGNLTPELTDVDIPAGDETAVPADLVPEAARWNTAAQLEYFSAARKTDAFTFVVIGDAEPGRFIWERDIWGQKGVFRSQMKAIASETAAFVMQLGDMVSRGIPGNYRLFYRDLEAAELKVPYFTTVGNHDRHWPHGMVDDTLYQGLFGNSDYYFDSGNWRFVSIDSSEERLTAAQLDWLDRVLDTTKRKVVFTHMPPRGLKSWTLGMTGIEGGADRFMDILALRGVERVYVGHVHGYGLASYRGVRFVLSGCGGSPLYPMPIKRFYHYLTVTAGPSGLHETVHPLKGAAFDIHWPGDGDFERLEAPPPPKGSGDDD